MKFLITTDLEGVGGIMNWDEQHGGTQVDLWQRKLMEIVEVAPVKFGFGYHHVACLPPQQAYKLIYEKVTSTIRRLDFFTPIVIPGPIFFTETTQSPSDPETLSCLKTRPNVEIKDNRTVIYHGRNVVEAIARRCGFE